MYDPKLISPEILTWVLDQAKNELHAYLCEVDFREMYGAGWTEIALRTASFCRSFAAASTEESDKESWLELAWNYESTAAAA